MVQRLKDKEKEYDWGYGILTKRDIEYIYTQNALINLATKYGIGLEADFSTVQDFLDNYCEPEGFKERLEFLNNFEEYLDDEGLLGLLDD